MQRAEIKNVIKVNGVHSKNKINQMKIPTFKITYNIIHKIKRNRIWVKL